MILTVVVPYLQKAQWESIDKELKGIDYEIIPLKDEAKALEVASGAFIVFLEAHSGICPGSLKSSLDVYLQRPSYRKLAMVATPVDYDVLGGRYGYTYEGGVALDTIEDNEEDSYPVSIGHFYGSVIRVSALKKHMINMKRETMYKTVLLSDKFWANGLRIELNPQSTYYAPNDVKPSIDEAYKIKTNSEALKVWQREFIL